MSNTASLKKEYAERIAPALLKNTGIATSVQAKYALHILF